MDKKGKESSYRLILFIMFITFFIAFFWDKLEFIKNSVSYLLDPSIGFLLNWNLNLGMLIIVFFLTLITTLVQKYATDQETLRELKKEQKEVQKEMKKYRENPQKILELQKKSFESFPKMMKLSMRGIIFTGIPFVLFFRWFYDFFNFIGNPKLFGIMNWFIFYIIFSLIFSSIFRKIFKIV
jgi:uncharacterized membrane protein (DUF106 family)